MANLKALIDRMVGVTFDILGDLTVSGTYQSVSAGYNPATGRADNTIVTYPLPSFVMSKFTLAEDNSIIVTTDFKAIFQSSLLPDGFEPKMNDRIVLANGNIYNVQKAMQVPGSSIQLIHVREA